MSKPRKHSMAAGMFCIMSMFFFSQGVTAIYPIQELLTSVFPDVSQVTMTYASTIVTIVSLISLVVLGTVLGKKLSYKAAAIIGFAFYGCGGALPFFFPNFTMILVGRAILGLGTGALQTLGAPLLTALIEDDEKRAKYTGICTFICYMGSCAVALLSGLLATVDWKLSFLMHAIALIGILAVILGMDEPDFSAKSESGEETVKSESVLTTAKKIPGVVWAMLICNGLVSMLCMQVDLSSSYVLSDMGASLGTISVSVSLAYVGYASGGLLYMPLRKILGKFTLAGAAGVAIIGQLICYFAGAPVLFIIGSMISSAGYTVSFTTVMYEITVVSDKSAVTLVNSVLMFCMSFCAFFSSPFYGFAISVTGDAIRGQFVLAILGLAIIMLIFCFARTDKITQKN